ncbi:solute carrier organic anion transporter family member 2A1-like [Mercenaria mercenaria]|uniref:solute carrier organic anion transporter family member 2A1-like n=1 Tax=Mercenaria mercenaria TaxID=6596 RepID=UPI00234F6604|nr:solute carrier organic anion transporter family member 2A1-like [Mercenaria mercenaria]
MSFGKQPECGIGACKPKGMRKFATVNWFTGIYSVTGLLTASLSMYIVSQVSTIEKQFGLSSTKTGYLMACNDIGYSVCILIASYFANRVHIPRMLCMSTILYGLSGILCSVPHFLFKPAPLSTDIDGIQIKINLPSLNLCKNSSEFETPAIQRTSNMSVLLESAEIEADNTARDVTMALIAIGMIIQGIGKAPRYPMLGQFLDDNTKENETGYYLGIITSVAIFGPAIAYGLGGFFSQLYVTLEDVDLHPHDPRWLGAWWLGFLAFGVAAVLCALPLFFFPSSLKPSTIAKSRTPGNSSKSGKIFGSFCREILGVFKSIFKVLSVPAYTIMLIATFCNVLGVSSVFSFGPKYMENMYNIPAWKANIILAGLGIPSVCLGTFVGGVATKKLKLNPLKCIMLILSTQIPTFGIQLITMFLGCDNPKINDWPDTTSTDLPSACSSDCACGNTFLPVCDSEGINYFSPCHAGCSQGSLMKFTNCTCVPNGEVTTGLCQFDCDMLWPFMIVSFIGSFLSSCLMMPTFVFIIKVVPNEIKSMAIGLSALSMSLFAWLPGPVIGGKLVDHACLLWSNGDSGSCTFYNLDTLRYNVFGWSVACRTVAILVLVLLLRITWNMREWPNNDDKQSLDFIVESKHKMKPGALIDKTSYQVKSSV